MRKKKFGKLAFLVIAALIIIGVGSREMLLNYFSLFNGGGNIVKPFKNKNSKEPVNILVMGVDIGTPGAKKEINRRRTDTIILVNYNPVAEKVNLISIPRDTLIEINGKKQKINAAHAIGGVAYLIESVEQILNLRVNYYGKVDYKGFREIIDAIGGVDMKISRNMNYDDKGQNLHIHFKKGETVRLDGKKAEEFFRWRKNNDGTGFATGDLGRIQNQHLFIEKVVQKLKSPAIITRIPSILKALPKYVETNMPANDVIKYGTLITKLEQDSMNMKTLQGDLATIDGVSYLVYDERKNQDILALLKEEKETIAKEKDINKGKLKIKVLNGTKINGLAGNFAKELKIDGYPTVDIGNTKEAVNSSVIVYGLDKKYEAAVKKEFKIENIIFESNNPKEYDIVVVLGEDFKSE
jgi:polyisoprenyl-teichoic acid--peptidoglycan teichoic acid transferase